MNLPVNGIIWQNNHGLALIFGHFIQSSCHYLDSRGVTGDGRAAKAGGGAQGRYFREYSGSEI